MKVVSFDIWALRYSYTVLSALCTPACIVYVSSIDCHFYNSCTTFGFCVPVLNVVVLNVAHTAPDIPPAPMMVSEEDQISPREVRLSWAPIPEFMQNGEILTYEVRIVDPRQASNKRDAPKPNSPEACFQAANASSDFTLTVPGSQTSVDVDRLSE